MVHVQICNIYYYSGVNTVVVLNWHTCANVTELNWNVNMWFTFEEQRCNSQFFVKHKRVVLSILNSCTLWVWILLLAPCRESVHVNAHCRVLIIHCGIYRLICVCWLCDMTGFVNRCFIQQWACFVIHSFSLIVTMVFLLSVGTDVLFCDILLKFEFLKAVFVYLPMLDIASLLFLCLFKTSQNYVFLCTRGFLFRKTRQSWLHVTACQAWMSLIMEKPNIHRIHLA